MQVFCDLIGDLKSDISPTHVTKMLLRTPDPPHTCGGLGTRLGVQFQITPYIVKLDRNRDWGKLITMFLYIVVAVAWTCMGLVVQRCWLVLARRAI